MPPRALSVPDPLAARLRSGVPVIDLGGLPEGSPAAEGGAVLWLLDGKGEVLGTALADPENECLRLLSREAVPSLGREFFRRRVAAALRLREALGLAGGRSAFRLLNAEGDELSGFVADAYGPYVVLYVYSRALVNLGRLVAEAIRDLYAAKGIVLKVRPRGGARPGKVRQEVIGEEPPEKWIAYESGVPYEVHLLSGMNAGLFTDMREHRRGIERFTRGQRVLNTFAYTGAFSVAAARAGAAAVTSVDLSSGVLKWARENFRLAGLDPGEPRFAFETADVFRFLQEKRAAGERYDTILLDPPTYSAARAAGWSMKNDYPELIAAAARLLPEEGGFLWLAANAHRGIQLERQVLEGIAPGGRTAQVLEIGGLPPDYPTPPAYPQARYLQVMALHLRGG
jgi:23S rRNA (cytosine1962-C5)-methyltransferase